jgi:hypothetical protein
MSGYRGLGRLTAVVRHAKMPARIGPFAHGCKSDGILLRQIDELNRLWAS